MSSRKNTCPNGVEVERGGGVQGKSLEDLTALIQLRAMRVPDATLNALLPRQSPAALSHRFCGHRITDTIERRVASSLRELDALQVGVVTVADAAYPQKLHELDDEKPPMLFFRGNWNLINTNIVAMVGTRRSTEYGNGVAEMLAGDLTRYGITIISGLALGIDAHAHSGALDAGGTTIAVLGCGIDVWYPQRNARLQGRIAEAGLLLSEFAPGEPAMPHHFLQRNRLIAKLAGGVVVVEAGMRSGSHNTAGWAGNYGVQVFAVPGPIGRNASNGTNALIQDGARLVASVQDIIDELPWRVTPGAASQEAAATSAHTSDAAARVFEVLGTVGMQIDQIARAAQCDTSAALVMLAELELLGVVRQLPGMRFVRASPEPTLKSRVQEGS